MTFIVIDVAGEAADEAEEEASTVLPRHVVVVDANVDGCNRHRPSDVVDVAVKIYGRVVVTQERRERGPGSVVQVANSAYPEEEVGTG